MSNEITTEKLEKAIEMNPGRYDVHRNKRGELDEVIDRARNLIHQKTKTGWVTEEW